MQKTLIDLQNISLKFSENLVFSNLNLKLEKNKIYGLIGPNGCGKTSLAKIIANLIKPTSGTRKTSSPRIYYEPQRSRAKGQLEIQVSDVLWYHDDKIIDQFNCREILHKSFHKLSGGWQQRVLLARAALTPCDLLILDEPFSMIDQDSRHELMHKLTSLKKASTILLISHEIDILTHCCDEILCLHHHLHTHKPEEIFEKLEHLGLKSFTGETHKLFEILMKDHHHD